VKVIRKPIVVLLKNVDHFVLVKKNDAGEALPQFRVCCMQIQRTIGLESLGFGRRTEGVLFRRFVLLASKRSYVRKTGCCCMFCNLHDFSFFLSYLICHATHSPKVWVVPASCRERTLDFALSFAIPPRLQRLFFLFVTSATVASPTSPVSIDYECKLL
jgi:hypothetical protein